MDESSDVQANRIDYASDSSGNQTAAAINRLNNALPLFPIGTDVSKFSDTEIVGLLAWSLPPAWRTKIDLDGYIPTLHSRAKLIEKCEVIERNAAHKEWTPSASKKSGKNNKKKNKNENGSSKHPKGDRSNNKSFYCSEHGKNPMHTTADCFTIKNCDKSGLQGANRSFSKKFFREEVNVLAKNKKKVLDMYVTAIKREQKKMQKQVAKHKSCEVASSDSESDSDVCLHIIDSHKSKCLRPNRKRALTNGPSNPSHAKSAHKKPKLYRKKRPIRKRYSG
jgi:hypothetical protein